MTEGPTSQEIEVDPGAGPVTAPDVDPEAPLDAPEALRDEVVADADREVPVPGEDEEPAEDDAI